MTLKNDIETKCDCCGWDDYGYQHEPYCSALRKKESSQIPNHGRSGEMKNKDKIILDVCCGGRMFWFDKVNPNTLYVDIRGPEKFTTGKGRHERVRYIRPDKVMDFRKLDLPDNQFNLVVFDPPHLLSVGANSFTAKTYGKLSDSWKSDISQGFSECFRVLKPYGILIFKWCEYEIPLSEILSLTPYKPLFGHKSGKKQKTHWLTFMKII